MDKATETQLANIEKRSGKSLEQLARLIKASGLTRHGEIREMLKQDFGMGHGDANLLTHHTLQSHGAAVVPGKTAAAAIDEIYSGSKAALRPIHDRVMAAVEPLGPFEVAPKKGYISLRRKKQFAMIGPATKSQVEVGLNARALPVSSRLTVVPPGAMCQYKVRLSAPDEVNDEMVAWLGAAYDGAE